MPATNLDKIMFESTIRVLTENARILLHHLEDNKLEADIPYVRRLATDIANSTQLAEKQQEVYFE
jgi:hypothetical protein